VTGRPSASSSGVSEPFYRADDDAPLQQGDVLLAPVLRLAAARHPAGAEDELIARASAQFAQAEAPVTPPDPELGSDVRVETGWGPVIVVSHDCQLDKEFNRRYRKLRAGGMTKAEAAARAEADPDLDRWVMVAPILDLDSAATDHADEQQAAAAGRGEVVGMFPVPGNRDRGIVDGVADLTWVSTVDRHTVVARLASIGSRARGEFRLALARTAALRTPELGFVLEDIVGDRIESAEHIDGSTLTVELTLRKDGTVMLLAQPGEPPSGGPQRSEESAPPGA
jgi:hypothetical protein